MEKSEYFLTRGYEKKKKKKIKKSRLRAFARTRAKNQNKQNMDSTPNRIYGWRYIFSNRNAPSKKISSHCVSYRGWPDYLVSLTFLCKCISFNKPTLIQW